MLPSVNEVIKPLEAFKGHRDMDIKEIASIFMRPNMIIWSWGIRDFVNVKNKALRFTVSGHHHKGHVYICVNGADLLDVVLTSNRGTVKHIMNDIFIEDLIPTLDKAIEKIAAYKY